MSGIEIREGTGPLLEPLPFSAGEYARRHAALLSGMERAGLDVFVSFGPENINYLTGHDTPAYQYLQACVVTRDQPPVNLLRSIDASNTLLRSSWRRAVAYADHDDPVATLVALIREVAPPRARVGLEDGAFFLTPRRHGQLTRRLDADGFAVIGADLVEEGRLLKSDEELAVIRRAGRITAAAMRAAIAAAADGVSEDEIAAAVWASLVGAGGQFPGLPPFIVSGERSSLGHATWGGRRLRAGDVLNFEIPGVVARYVAPLFRTGTVGAPPAGVRAIEAACRASLDVLFSAMRPGTPLAELHRLNVASFARHGFALGHRTGYSVGVGYAPDWGEGDVLSIVEGETRALAPGMVFHLVPGIYAPGRHAVVISETVIVTPTGIERAVEFPQNLFVV